MFTLGGTNSFGGGVTLNAGAIQVGTDLALGTGTLTFTGGRLSSDSATNRTLGNALSLIGTLALGDATNNGALSLSGNATLTGATTLTVASAATLGGIVSGAFDLVKDGAADLTLAGANTFSGTTTVNGGTLTLAGGNALANSMAVTVNASGLLKLANSEEIATLAGAGAANLQANVLTVSGGTDTTFSGVLSGAGGALVKNGSGVFTLTGANTFDGGLTLNAGAIQASNAAALGIGTLTFTGGRLSSDSFTARTLTNALTLSGSLTLGDSTNYGVMTLTGDAVLAAAATLTTASAGTLSGIMSGAFDFTKAGTSTLTLSGTNSYTGITTVAAGTLVLSGGAALADTMAVVVNADGTLRLASDEEIASLSGSGVVDLHTSQLTLSGSANTTFSGLITNQNGSIVKTGSSIFTITGANNFVGGVRLSNGAIELGNDLALGTGTLTFNGGRLSSNSSDARSVANAMILNGSLTFGAVATPGALVFGGSTALAGDTNLTISSPVTLAGAVGGNYNLSIGGSSELILSGTNTFTGLTNVTGGTLTLASGAALIDTMAVTVNGGATVQLAAAETLGSLAGAGALKLQSNTLTVGGTLDAVFSGIISGSGGLSKTGSSILTLAGTNTFSGGVNLSSGSLFIANDAALGTGTLTVLAGVLASDSTTARTLANALVLDGNLNLGDVTNTGKLTLSGALSLTGNRTLTLGSEVELSGAISGANGFTKTGALLTLSGTSTFSGALVLSGGSLALSNTGVLQTNTLSVAQGATFEVANTAQLSSGATLTANGTVNLNATAVTLAGLEGASTGLVTLNTTNLRLSAGTFAGVFADGAAAGSLEMVGSGALTLGGVNTFTGAATVSAGSLNLISGASLATTAVVVSAAGSLSVASGPL